LEREPKFASKEIFIYLTKMHSTKDVIYRELQEQRLRGYLDKLDFSGQGCDIMGRQYKTSYIDKETSRSIQIIIGTIDSFTLSIGNKNPIGGDYFRA
jgi:hypothetical protein